MARKLTKIRIRPKEIAKIVGKLIPESGSDWVSVGVTVNFLVGVSVAETEAVGDPVACGVGVGLPVSFKVGVGVDVEDGIGVGVKVGAWAKGSCGAPGDIPSFLD